MHIWEGVKGAEWVGEIIDLRNLDQCLLKDKRWDKGSEMLGVVLFYVDYYFGGKIVCVWG